MAAKSIWQYFLVGAAPRLEGSLSSTEPPGGKCTEKHNERVPHQKKAEQPRNLRDVTDEVWENEAVARPMHCIHIHSTK